jgi:hypothetical protein
MFRVRVSVFSVENSGFTVQGSGFRVQDLVFRVIKVPHRCFAQVTANPRRHGASGATAHLPRVGLIVEIGIRVWGFSLG